MKSSAIMPLKLKRRAHQHQNRGMVNDIRHPGIPASRTFYSSTFSAACAGYGRTLLGLLAVFSAALPTVFTVVTAVVLAALLTATAGGQADPEPCSGGGFNPTPTAVEVDAVPIVVESTTDDYFVLYVKHDVDGAEVELPVLVKLGESGTMTLAENVEALPKERYRVEKYLIADPADVDGDCVDDITELNALGTMNPLNPAAALALNDGAVAVPDTHTYDALAVGSYFKFALLDMDTDRPSAYFINAKTHPTHQLFLDDRNISRQRVILGAIAYNQKLVAPDGSQGVYRYSFNTLPSRYSFSFSLMERTHTLLAASMPLLEDNLALYVRNSELPHIQSDLPLYRESRINLVFDGDVYSNIDFLALNLGEGVGRLQVLDPDDRPHSRDVVIYEALPNELPRVAGIISTVPQTPLSHVNLRAIQDGIPNAYIRDIRDDPAIAPLIGDFIRYEVTEDGYSIRAATKAEVDAHYESSRPDQPQTPERDLSVTGIKPLSQIGFEDWTAFGVKAANVAVLGKLGFPEGTVPDGFAIPFYFYDEFMKALGFYDDVKEMLADEDFQTDFDTQDDMLDDLRDDIEDADSPQWIIDALMVMHATYPEGQSLRYRSSTNNEDLPGFNGAGLYDSKTQDPDETMEDGIDKSLKGVFASLWTFRAFTERDFHRIDHMAAKMGVLVHPNYSDELANGVAVSFDPVDDRGRDERYYVNTQLGEDLVTNPDALSVPEEILLNKDGRYRVLVTSNQVPPGQLLMSDAQLAQLAQHLSTIHDHFHELYNPTPNEPFAMEIEFKITSWEAPEDDGGSAVTDYEYRIDQRGDWISIGSTATTHTVTGLVNGTAYVFQVRALNRIGRSGPSLPAEATPIAQVVLDLAHFANGAGIISEVVLVNVAPHPIRPALYFYDQEGEPIAAESMVDVLGDLGIQEDGGLTIRTEMEPLGELTISTHGRGDLVSGSVKVAAYGAIGGVLRFDLPGIGVAGVQVSQPLRDAIFPVRRREGGIDTGMALHNREEEAAVVSCRLMKNGAVLEEVEITLAANGQVARFIGEVFTGTDTSDFVGLVRCTAEGVAQFTGMALELDAGNRIFTTLPVVKVNRGRAGEAALDFAHFANGASIVSEMVFMNLETQPSGPPLSPFHQAIPPTRPVIYFYDQEGNPIDPALLVDLTGDLEITEDGALSIQSEMEPLGELTISTHGRGELVSGSVRVVSDGPIGGVLRFDLPGIGVAGVGASQPVRDAIFPARRQAGGISTAAAIHNLGEEALVVSCQLMKAGAVLEEEEISLEANGQEARYIEEMFTSTDTSDFVGSVRCTAPPGEGMFTGVAVELDAGNRIFTTLPVVPVPERMSQE